MISRWPIRSEVAVKDGVVHFAVGMWSSEGVYMFALDAKTAKEVWCNDTNLHYLPMPHASTAHTGNMPQGYLAIGGNRVVYNNSVEGCWTYDARTGRLGKRLTGRPSKQGSRCMVPACPGMSRSEKRSKPATVK